VKSLVLQRVPEGFDQHKHVFRCARKSEPAGAGGGNCLGGGRGQFPVPHAVEHPFHYGDNLRGGCSEPGLIGLGDLIGTDACPGQHGGRIGQLTCD
jgi:hypothetical protein